MMYFAYLPEWLKQMLRGVLFWLFEIIFEFLFYL